MTDKGAMSFFDNPRGARRSSPGKDTTRVVCIIPKGLHRVIAEITFRERITLKQYVVDAAEELRSVMQRAERKGRNKYQVVTLIGYRYDRSELVHPTLLLPTDLAELLREAAHYGKDYGVTSYRQMMIDILYKHLDKYREKYEDLTFPSEG